MAKMLDVEVINPIAEPEAAPAPEVSAAPEVSPEAIEAAADNVEAEAKEEPAYTPNLKFKFTDEEGEKEAELEEWVRPFVNKDTEEKFRDIFSKAKGIDFVKSRRDKIAQDKQEIEAQFNQTKTALQEIAGLRDKDLGLFLEKVGLNEQQVAKWLLERAEAQEKLKDLPEPLRNLYNENERLRRANIDYEKQLEGARGGSLEAATTALSMGVQNILARPEVAAIAQDFDTRRGESGAFFEMVRREGELEWARSNKVLTPDEAVSRALRTLALQPQAPSQGATPNGAVATPNKVIIPGKTAVIPNVGGGSASVGAKKPRSIDDLRTAYKEMAASNRS